MPILQNARHERFAQLVASGKSAFAIQFGEKFNK
jgi:hypothetical protein